MVELDRRTLFRAGATGAGGLLVTAGSGLVVPASAAPARGRTLARNLVVPWGIAFLPSGDALVGERISARIHRVDRRGGRRRVGRVPGVRDGAGEGGLLGLALHPRFRRNRWVYAYISTSRDNRIVRFRYAGGELGRPEVVLAGIPTAGHHNGGRLAFGPDGMLYASTGDAGQPGLAQDRDSRAGKILRITPRGEVPDGNPFGNHTWSYGHRNVEGIAFDGRGRLWATEFGEQTTDELNLIRKGHNYGWPRVEGGDGRGGRFHDPFVTWRPTSSCSPSGVAIANGRAWVGALRGEALMEVVLNGPDRRRKRRHFAHDFGRIRTVQEAPDGSLWITTSNRDGRGDPGRNDDRVIRIRLP
jgi:glucose/arabinose dehydrogenase